MRRLLLLTLALNPLLLFAGLEWESTHLKLPAVVNQKELVGIYKFTNVGDEPITIERVSSSCGCTVPELSKETYAAGESGEVKAVFTVGDRLGPQRKTIIVKTDDETHPSYQLILETNIPAPVELSNKMLLWRKGTRPDWKETRIKTDPENEVTIPLGPGYEDLPPYQLEKSETEPGKYLLRIKPESTEDRKQVRFPIVIKFPDGEEKQYHVFLLIR